MLRTAVILVTVAALSSFCWCEEEDQDYMVYNDQVESFGGALETIVNFGNMKMIKRERFLNGTAIFGEDMDDLNFKFGAELLTSPARDGNFKKMGMDVPPTTLCEGLKKFYTKFLQPSFLYDINTDIPYVPDDGLCPFPAGEYYLKEIAFSTKHWPNQMPRGLLKVIISFYKHDSVVGGFAIVVRVEDK